MSKGFYDSDHLTLNLTIKNPKSKMISVKKRILLSKKLNKHASVISENFKSLHDLNLISPFEQELK